MMVHTRTRCWDEDALSAVSIALYLYLAFGAVHALANVDRATRTFPELLNPVKTLHTMASPCRWTPAP
jgi:hypothetical protein